MYCPKKMVNQDHNVKLMLNNTSQCNIGLQCRNTIMSNEITPHLGIDVVYAWNIMGISCYSIKIYYTTHLSTGGIDYISNIPYIPQSVLEANLFVNFLFVRDIYCRFVGVF
jgi:hypothetical protein